MDHRMEVMAVQVATSTSRLCTGRPDCISWQEEASSKPAEESMEREVVKVGREARMSSYKFLWAQW